MLMMNLPNTVVHALDGWSPLVPHPTDLRLWRAPAAERRDGPGGWAGGAEGVGEEYDPAVAYRFPDVLQRNIDAEQGNREFLYCETCEAPSPALCRTHLKLSCLPVCFHVSSHRDRTASACCSASLY